MAFRPVRWLLFGLLGVAAALLVGWCALALRFAPVGPESLRVALAWSFPIAALGALLGLGMAVAFWPL